MVKPRQLGHLVLRVRDVDASETWYQDILGLHTTHKRAGQIAENGASRTAFVWCKQSFMGSKSTDREWLLCRGSSHS